MRVCLAYDCLFPWTVGGAERWYRHLAERLVESGHEVTYLTRDQWGTEPAPDIHGVEVVAVSKHAELYGPDGRRTIGEAVRFGWGVFAHLLCHRRRYDVVHLGSFPYFSLLGARLALAGAGATVFVDWHEVWTADYWRTYLGGVRGAVGQAVQRVCVRLTPHAFVFSDMNAARLRKEGLRGEPERLPGLFTGVDVPVEARRPAADPPTVLFAGRHIPEKRVPLIVPALAAARARRPQLRAMVLGDGPDREELRRAIAAAGLEAVIDAPGFVAAEVLREAMLGAVCLLLPSEREGYGMVVIEAAACGTPSVVIAGPDNAATELIEEGVNGYVAHSAQPADVAEALIAVCDAGSALRESTGRWFAEHAARLSADASVAQVLRAYEAAARS